MLSQPVRDHVLNCGKNQRSAVTDGQFETPRPICSSVEITTGHLLNSKLRVIWVIPATTMNGFVIIDKARNGHRPFKCGIVASDDIEVSRHEGTVSMDSSSSPAHENGSMACC